jgi:putative spermidine/putrescine transport system substrate-binding protein
VYTIFENADENGKREEKAMKKRPMMNRREFALFGSAVAAGTLFAPNIVRAETRTIQIHGPTGTAKVFKEKVFPGFEAAHDCKVVYEASNSLEGLQKLRADKAKPVATAVVLDTPVMLLASADGLLDPVDAKSVPNMAKLFPAAINQNGMFLNYKWPRLAIAYNTTLMKGVDSWKDLWDPKYAHKILIPSPSVTQFPVILAAAAHYVTGKPLLEAQYDIESAFKGLAEIKPNLLDVFGSSAAAATLIEQGEASMGAGFFSTYVLFRTAAGAPIDLASPKEGSFSLPNAVAKTKNGPHPDLADAFIDLLLSDKIQEVLMAEFKDTPTNSDVKLAPGIVSGKDLLPLDWEFAVKNLEANANRFKREMTL